MDTNLEIEYKILLTPHIYETILKDYQNQITEQYTQINYYLIHPILDSLQYMLRIREKKNTYELTLKQPTKEGNIETNVPLTKHQKERLLTNKNISNPIIDILSKLNISIVELDTSQSLTTYRTDIVLDNGTLSIDKNSYHAITDYELEFEVTNPIDGYSQFLAIIKPYDLTYTENCASKIKRLKLSF